MYETFLTYLNEDLVNQPDAVKAFARAAVQALDGPFRRDRPLSVLLVAGPTGTGKTHLAELFSRLLLGDPRAMIKLNPAVCRDMGPCLSYLWQLCGSPAPGPRVVFVETLELASPSLLELLIHVFRNGELAVGPGTTLDFRRTVFVLETAVAEREVDEVTQRAVGFQDDLRRRADDQIREHIESKIRATFPLRLLSLLDDVVYFRMIRPEDLPYILDRMIHRLRLSLSARGLDLHVEDAARELLLSHGRRQMRFGAAGLRQAADRHLQLPLQDYLACRPAVPGTIVYARRSLGGITFFVPQG